MKALGQNDHNSFTVKNSKYCSGAMSNYSGSYFLITDLCVFLSYLQAKVESLKRELEAVSQSKAMLEKELQEVINLTSTELEEYQEKVMELEDEVKTCSHWLKETLCSFLA